MKITENDAKLLMVKFRSRAYRFTSSRNLHHFDADDILQEMFLAGLRSPDRSIPPDGWWHTVMKHRARSLLKFNTCPKRGGRLNRAGEDAVNVAADNREIAPDVAAEIKERIERIPAKYMESLSHQNPPGRIRIMQYRARERFFSDHDSSKVM